ncbi:ATP-binding protein [Gemmatimonas aurantiaca]|uniref:two-component system sensor histidine kinase NtrB n=1 Tax=Gemmatimonas aurantiaca TaxID=173480 RepID=UPI00301D4706
MRHTPALPQAPVQEMLDPSRMLRWVWLGRAVLACAILVAAVFVWNRAEASSTLIATLAFAGAILGTGLSMMYLGREGRAVGPVFYAGQCLLDLLLVTTVVHLTGGWSSQFAALYIPVIASGALLLSFRGGLAMAAAACVLYALDALWLRSNAAPYAGVLVQIGVFGVVAIGSAFVVQRLRQAGLGREALAAQLIEVQLEAADILRTIRSGILTIDGRGFLLYANPAASELLGVDLRGHTGHPVLPLLARISPRLAELLEQSARDQMRTTRAEGVIHRDGEEIEIGVTTTIADAVRRDGTTSATAIFQDISDSKRLQALHVRAERLQAVAELSASLAHEIRNPLASIRSATEQLAHRRSLRADADEDERILHGLIVREADRLSRLLADFLDFARARVARMETLDLGALAHTAAMLAASHPDRQPGVQVTVDAAPGLPRAHGDEDLLHRAVFNLVLNAIQALGEQGHVFVEVDRYHPASHGVSTTAITGELVAISVTDDGPGIPEELRDRLFEPFVTSKSGGSGLGLPVVHRAVEAHRGVVLVDPLPQGTRFSIVLPLSTASSSSSQIGVAA